MLLAATAAGLGSAPISDVVEVPQARRLIGQVLGWGAYPQMAVRVGHSPPGAVATSPRRDPAQVITS